MTEWFEAARWCAGAVLIVSGILKLGRGETLHQSLGTLGFSAHFVQSPWTGRLLVPAVPLAEIVAGSGAIAVPTRVFPIAVFAAFLAFLVIIIRGIRVGRGATCDCFGGYGDARVGWRTVVRNSVLLAVSAVGILAPHAPALSLGASNPLLGVAALALPVAVAVALAAARPGVERRRIRRLADSLALRDASGSAMPLRQFGDPPTYLVFFSASCLSCRRLVERFRWWPEGLPEGHDLQPVFIGRPESFADIAEFAPLAPHAWYDHDRSVARAVGLNGTPGVVLIDRENPLGSGWVRGGRDSETYVLRHGFYDELRASLGDEAAPPQDDAS